MVNRQYSLASIKLMMQTLITVHIIMTCILVICGNWSTIFGNWININTLIPLPIYGKNQLFLFIIITHRRIFIAGTIIN